MTQRTFIFFSNEGSRLFRRGNAKENTSTNCPMPTADEYWTFKSCENGWSHIFSRGDNSKNTFTTFKNHLFKHQMADFDYPWHKISPERRIFKFCQKKSHTLFQGGDYSKNVSASTEDRNLYIKESPFALHQYHITIYSIGTDCSKL